MKRGYLLFTSLGEEGTASTTSAHKGQPPNWIVGAWAVKMDTYYPLYLNSGSVSVFLITICQDHHLPSSLISCP